MGKGSKLLLNLAVKALKNAASSTPSNSPSNGTARPNGDWRSIVQSAAGSFGGVSRSSNQPVAGSVAPPKPTAIDPKASDRAAVARYDYLVQAAGPDQLEKIHQSAFAALTPAYRDAVAARMRQELPAHERPQSPSPLDLAWAATRAERMRPGRMRGLLARTGGSSDSIGGSGIAGGALIGVAGGAIASAAAAPLLEQAIGLGVDFDALANMIDLASIAGSIGGFAGGAGEAGPGLGRQTGAFGGGTGNPGSFSIGDLFKR